ncbi:MAG: DUF3048 domain-containing protein [Eubacteriales bacterium]
MKKILMLILIIVVIFTIVACQNEKDENDNSDTIEENIDKQPEQKPEKTQEETSTKEYEKPITEEENYEGKDINPLTGLWIDEEVAKRRPVGIMISNIKVAQPQSGISQADIVYETLVEGGITRLFAIYQEFDAEKIGPVRSARHYYLDYAFDHDAIFVHYGESPQAKVAFKELKTPNLSSYALYSMWFKDSSRVAPHSTYTSYEGIINAWDKSGYRTNLKDQYEPKFQFSDEEISIETDIIANKVTLPFSHVNTYTSWFEFNNDIELYERVHMGGESHIDVENNELLKYKNIIVQYTDIWGIPGDTEGRLEQKLISTGTGYYITNGKATEITWEKKSHYEPTKYYDKEGNEIQINKGKTWIAIFPSNKEIILE